MISILGCGWYGLPLGKILVQQGFAVNGSTTSAERLPELADAGLTPYLVNLTEDKDDIEAAFFNCETLIISIPPKLRSGDGDNYLANLQLVISNIIKYKISRVIYISSTGVYPESNSAVDEQTDPEPQAPSGKILLAAENLFRNQTAFKTTIIRFGGLVGPGRHPGRFFAGKTNIPNGQAPVNLIHLQDCIGLTQNIIQQNAYGYTFNACSPHHPAKQEFYTLAAANAGLPLPVFNDELLEWKRIDSVYTNTLLNYRFGINNWQNCFAGNYF